MADAKAGLELSATDRTGAAFSAVTGRLNKFRTEANQVASRVGIAFAAVGAGVTLLTRQQMGLIDQLAKSSDALRIQTEALVGLQHGADLAGVSQDSLATALQRQQKTLYDASEGLSTATAAIENLGLTTEQLLAMSTQERFLTIADAISKVENAALQAGIAQNIFGRAGQELLPFINQGREAIEAYAADADYLGLSLSRVDAAMVEQANDAMTRAQNRMAGLGRIIAVEVAPIIEGLANDFVTATGDADNMRAVVSQSMDVIASGVGLVSDAFRGWHLLFKAIEIAALRMGAGVINVFEKIDDPIIKALDLAAKFNPILRPTVLVLQAASGQLSAFSESLSLSADDASMALSELAAAEKPSEKIAQAIERWRAASAGTAQNTAAIASSMMGQLGAVDLGDPESDAAAKLAEQQAIQLENQLEQVRQYTLTREQVEIEAMNRRQAIIADAYAQELIGFETAQQLSAEVARRGQAELTRIAQEGAEERAAFMMGAAAQTAQGTLGLLEQMTAGTAQHSKAMFNVNKAAAIGNAIISTAQGVTKALELPFPANLAAAAVVAAAGAKQIQLIKSTQFGGGTTPSLAGGTGSVNGQPVAGTPVLADRSSGRGGTVINLQGAQFYGAGGPQEFADLLVETLDDRINNSDVQIIRKESRQAATIRGGA